MGRREWGSGSVFETKSGRWRVVIPLGTDINGRRRRKEWQVRSEAAAKAKLKDVNRLIRGGFPVEASRVTLAAYAPEWLGHIQVGRATAEQYRHLARHLTDELGHYPLARIGPSEIRTLIAKRQAEGYAARTIRGVVDVLRMILRQAMADGILSRNVAELVQKPRLEQKEPRHFTAEQARRFLDEAKDDPLFSLVAVALGTGLRRAELLGLTWRDVDLDTNHVNVRRSKTAAGLRSVPLPAFAADALRRLERRPGPIWQVSPSHVTRMTAKLCERAGLPRLTTHGLRHSAASMLLAEGVHPMVISQIMGHSRVTMTAHYARSEPAQQREAMERLGRALG